jgi:hypothetical protein
MKNDLIKDTIGITIEFKGNVTRSIIYNVEIETAFVQDSEFFKKLAKGKTKKATTFKVPSDPTNKANSYLKKIPILTDKKFIADMKNKKMRNCDIVKKYKLKTAFVQYHRKRKLKK